METPTKSVLVPVDGSENALNSLDYLNLMFGSQHDLEIQLLYVLPNLPPLLTEAPLTDARLQKMLKKVEERNRHQGREIIKRARARLEKMGFEPRRIKTDFHATRGTTAKDICHLANRRHVDAVLMTRRGNSNMLSFFMGSVTRSVLEYRPDCPIWIAGRQNISQAVLVALESSPNAASAVQHVGKMLAGTECRITLFHAMRHLQRYIPAEILDEASDLTELWTEKIAQAIRPVMDDARDTLLRAGIEEQRISEKITAGSRSAANDIITEATENHYGTIVLAHGGKKPATRAMFGGVTAKVLNSIRGIAVWVT